MRCVHEASLYPENCFITLTYDDQHVPVDGSLHYPDFQNFLKRLRKHFAPMRVRFYMGGEYGEQNLRPHFHACLFGIDFHDRRPWKKTSSGATVDRSQLLERLWPFGHSSVGDLTFESAAYVARYIMKKVTGDQAEDHYQGRTPEFNRMSLKPGVGARWLEKYQADVYPHDYVVINGQEVKPPKYYDRQFSKVDPDAWESIQHSRHIDARSHYEDNTPERLAVREQIAKARSSMLKRGFS